MIERLQGFPDDVAAFACHGHVTKADYETVLIPDVDDRFTRHDKLRVYYEVPADFDGVDAGAVWDDTKVGLSHLRRWERLAVVTDVDWIRRATDVFGFLMPAQLRVFPTAEAEQAREWISQPRQ